MPSIPLEVWGFFSLITACITIWSIGDIIHKNDPQFIREMATRTAIQTRVATYEGQWVSDLDTVIRGYMQAMHARDRVRALSLFGHNRTSADYLDMLLREQREALFADYTDIFVHNHGVNWEHMQAEAQARITYANGGTRSLQAGFVFEDSQWKLAYAHLSQESKPYATSIVSGH